MKKIIVLSSLLILLSSCAAPNPIVNYDGGDIQPEVVTELQTQSEERVKAGFFRGVWHGFVSPIALVGHIFNPEIGVYQTYNTGNWYAFGFLFGVGALGSSSSSKK